MHYRSFLTTVYVLTGALVCGCGGSATDRQPPAAQDQRAETPAQPAAAPPQKEQPPQAAEAPPPRPAATTGSAAKAAPKAKRAPSPTPQETAAAELAAAEKARTEQLLQEQREANAKLQQQLEEMKPRDVTLPEGTVVPIRTATELSTARLSNGSTFEAVLENNLVADQTVVAKAGSRVTGVVVSSDPGGRVKGTASLAVGLRSIEGVKGKIIALRTDSYSVDAKTTKGKDAVRTGVATGIGAIVGGIAGGGKGAAIGAGTGAAAGVGTAMATRGEAAVIPAETLIEFRLASPVTVTIQP
jgi:hypothetical protein